MQAQSAALQASRAAASGQSGAAAASSSQASGQAQGQGQGQAPGQGTGEGAPISEGSGASTGGGAAGEAGPLGRGELAEAEQTRGDWGKLPPRTARDLMDGRREEISGTYRDRIEAYFKAVSDKAKEKEKP